MKFRLYIFVSLFLLYGCGGSPSKVSQPSPISSPISSTQPSSKSSIKIIKISDVAGKYPDEVAKIFGSPTSTETVKPSRTPCPCQKNSYKNGTIEIVFIKGKADWITIKGFGDAPYSEVALTLLGIEPKPATFSNDNVMRWENIPGLLSVSIFPAQGSVNYAYVKTATP